MCQSSLCAVSLDWTHADTRRLQTALESTCSLVAAWLFSVAFRGLISHFHIILQKKVCVPLRSTTGTEGGFEATRLHPSLPSPYSPSPLSHLQSLHPYILPVLVLGVKQTSVLLFQSCPGPSLGANLLLKRFSLPAASTCIHTRRQSSASQRAQIRLMALTHLSGSWLLPLLFLLLLLLSESQQRGWLRCSLKTKLIFYFGNPEEKATSALCPRVTLASLFEKAPHPIISAHLGKLTHARAQGGSQSLRVVLFRLCVFETLNMLPLSDETLAHTHTCRGKISSCVEPWGTSFTWKTPLNSNWWPV